MRRHVCLHVIPVLLLCGLAAGRVPASATALNRAGELMQGHRYSEAAAEYQRAIALDPSWAAPRLGLGQALDELHDLSGALNAYQKAVALRPDWHEANIALGSALLRADRTRDAIPILQEAIRLAPVDARPKALLGMALSGQGRDVEALREFQAALRLSPNCLDAAEMAAYQLSSSRVASHRPIEGR